MTSSNPRRHVIIAWTIGITLAVEAITIALRFGANIDAVQFNATEPPFLLKIHHAFWSIPLLLIIPLVWRWPKTSGTLLGIGLGLILSDAIHHLVVLPITVGNMGWHWP